MKLKQGALISPGEALTDQALRRFFENKSFVINKEFPLRKVIDAEEGEGEWDYYTKGLCRLCRLRSTRRATV
jgi:hypothetical protein